MASRTSEARFGSLLRRIDDFDICCQSSMEVNFFLICFQWKVVTHRGWGGVPTLHWALKEACVTPFHWNREVKKVAGRKRWPDIDRIALSSKSPHKVGCDSEDFGNQKARGRPI